MSPQADADGTTSGYFRRIDGLVAPKATVLALSLLLALGSAPGWVEWLALAFLWTIVTVGFLAMALSPLGFRDPPEARVRQSLVQEGTSGPKKNSLLLGIAWRLPLLAAVGALYFSGRPILASLYLLLPFAIAVETVAVRRWAEGVDRPRVTAAA